jgi:hypothetical protein
MNWSPTQLDANKSPCVHRIFCCLDLRLVECNCLFREVDERIKLVAAVENRSRLLIRMSLQSSSDCKHDRCTCRSGIEQFDLFRKIRQKPPAVSKSCRPAPPSPSLWVRLVKQISKLNHRPNMTKFTRRQKVLGKLTKASASQKASGLLGAAPNKLKKASYSPYPRHLPHATGDLKYFPSLAFTREKGLGEKKKKKSLPLIL